MDEILHQCWEKIVRNIMNSCIFYMNVHKWNTLELFSMGGWRETGMGNAEGVKEGRKERRREGRKEGKKRKGRVEKN